MCDQSWTEKAGLRMSEEAGLVSLRRRVEDILLIIIRLQLKRKCNARIGNNTSSGRIKNKGIGNKLGWKDRISSICLIIIK